MKLLTVLFLLLITHNSFSKEKVETLKKESQIEIHEYIMSLIDEIVYEEATPQNLKSIKGKLSKIVESMKQLVNSNSKTQRNSSKKGLNLIYQYDYSSFDFYVYNIDSTLAFSNIFFGFVISEQNDNGTLENEMSLKIRFSQSGYLQSFIYITDETEINATYYDDGSINQYSKTKNGNYVGKRYVRENFGTEETITEFSEYEDKHYTYLKIADYSNINKISFTEYKLNYHQDTVTTTHGLFDYSGNTVKTGEWTTHYYNGNIKLIHHYEMNNEKQSVLNGDEYYFFRNGDTALVNHYNYGARNEEWLGYHKNKQIKHQKFYNNGLKQGKHIEYFENGNISTIKYYNESGEPTNKWLRYYTNKKLAENSIYSRGQLNGRSMRYSDSGSIMDSCFYINGIRESYRITYYDPRYIKGKHIVFQKMNYKGGKIDGIYLVYHSNGVLSYSCFYIKGKKNGIAKSFYYNNGTISDSTFYINGAPEGMSYRFHENGNVSDSTHFKNGKKNGISNEYFSNGKLKRNATYSNGKLTNFNDYYSDGSIKQKYNLDLKTELASDTTYYPNGIIYSIKAFIYTDYRFGEWLTKDRQGNLTSKLYYHENNLVDGFEILPHEYGIDSTFYDSRKRTRTEKRYYKTELTSQYIKCYNIVQSISSSHWTKKEEGLIRKKTYYVDISNYEKDEEYYKEEVIIGEETKYYLNGNKKEVVIRLEQGEEWTSKIKHYKNGQIKAIEQNENWDGYIIASFNKKGKINSYLSEAIDMAEFYSYYKNDSLYEKNIYDNGNLTTTTYYPNGNVQKITRITEFGEYDFYRNKINEYGDFQDKTEQFFDERGTITKEITTFYNGEEQRVKYYIDGKLSLDELYEDSEGSGIFLPVNKRAFYANGNEKYYKRYEFSEMTYGAVLVYYEDYYESGGIKTIKKWDLYGVKLRKWTYYNDDTKFDKNGEIIEEPTIKEEH